MFRQSTKIITEKTMGKFIDLRCDFVFFILYVRPDSPEIISECHSAQTSSLIGNNDFSKD